MNRRKVGNQAEDLAAKYLRDQGYQILERNYRYERGEIDLIAQEGGELVFVEVKARRSSAFGPPEDAVTPQKQKQIRRVAEGYLFEKHLENQACRFDVVAISYNHGKPNILVLRNAF